MKLSNFQTFTPPSHTHTCTHEEKTVKNVPPAFPEYPWPAFLKRMIDRGDTPAQKDILLLGGITVLGATLNKSIRISYGRKFYYPCLQTFIVAPPASGKGALAWTRRLAEPIHEAMMANYRQRHKAYREEKSRWDSLGKKKSDTPEPEMPPLKMFLIAGNNSGTGVLENLIEADGIGLICETEADTVSTAIGTDYGHWSDTLRKCYDHDRLAFNRRMNHEYLADKQVVTSGYDKKSYQYHLLGIKHTSLAAANFYNNFSVLPLKKRIKMLNRKRTHNIMVGKYLMFIPVAALLLLFSNCANKKADKVQSDTEKADTIELTAEPEKTAEPQVDITITETKGDSIYSVVETMPDFPGGQKELLSFLSRNIKYPTKAIENKIQGRVIVQFVVNKDGSISGAKVVRSVDPDLDKEALRVINSMPKWKPGMQKGEPVSVKFTVPIVFRNQLN